MYEAARTPDGDVFQNSPVKLVFFAGFHGKPSAKDVKLTSVSTVDVNASDAKLCQERNGVKKDCSNMTLSMSGVQCLWPRQEDLSGLLCLLNHHPCRNLGPAEHDFPWNETLSLFNDKSVEDPQFLKCVFRHLSLDFLCNATKNHHENLAHLKGFIQFVTPTLSNAIEGDHQIELSDRLLHGIALKQSAPFLTINPMSVSLTELPFNSAVHKPIQAVVHLPANNSSSLCLSVVAHLKRLSRKTAEQKTLCIRDSWRSLYQSICSALDNDETFLKEVCSTQKELYEGILKPRQEPDCKACRCRQRLGKVIADVIFEENPTATLAASNKPKPPDAGNWKEMMKDTTWTAMDDDPFPMVNKIGVCFLFVLFLQIALVKFIWQSCIFFLSPDCHPRQCWSAMSAQLRAFGSKPQEKKTVVRG